MWTIAVDSINTLIDSLAQPTTEVGRVITAVAEGDLSEKMMLEIQGRPVKGEFLRIGTIVNTMVDQWIVCLRSDPRRQGSRHRGKAGGPGRGERGRRHLEGPHR